MNKSYIEYLDEISLIRIHRQDCAIGETSSVVELSPVTNHTNIYTNTFPHVIADIDAHIYQQVTKVDILIHNKTRGFLNHQQADFEFIGPDRAPILINTVQACLQAADNIRATGLPKL